MVDFLGLGNYGANLLMGTGSDAGMQAMSPEQMKERELRMAPLLRNVPMAERVWRHGSMNAYQRPNPTPLPLRLAALDAGLAAFKANRASLKPL